MLRRLVLCGAIAALFLVPVAAADGGGPPAGTTDGGRGVANEAGTLRYVSVQVPQSNSTVVEAVQTSDGQVVQWTSVLGPFGIPLVAQSGQTGGLSADGKTLVLADGDYPQTGFRTTSHFSIFDARALPNGVQTVVLPGDFAYDALSPDGKTLFLIQHVSQQNSSRYVVRAYDLEVGKLLPQRIADRTQKSWVMQGYPLDRATSPGGRFVYTLYMNPGGYPFVHALDTVTRTAHCVGIPFTAPDQSALYNIRLALRDGGRTLALDWRSGRHYLAIDTRSYRISYPHASFPWAAVLGGSLGGLALLLAGGLVLRRRRRGAAAAGEFEAFLREQRERDRVPV